MAYTKRKTTTYGQRVSGSAKEVITGLLLFIIGTALLFLNEGNYVKTRKTIREAEGVTVHVDDVSAVNPELNGKLIHASAFADTEEVLTDGLFGVSEQGIALNRKVEYYQYEEKAHTETVEETGGEQETITTYTYEKKWVSNPVNSREFEDPAYLSSNFVLVTIEEKTEYAQQVTFGGYSLPPFIISSISGDVPVELKLTGEDLAQWKSVIAGKTKAPGVQPDSTAGQLVHVAGNVVYFGKIVSVPQIGDVRVTLTKVLPKEISIIAKVNGSTFEPYVAKSGKPFSSVSMGKVSAENMFAAEHAANSKLTWILRLVGALLVIGGLKLMVGILPALLKVLPFIGNIVESGVGVACAVGGSAWSLLVIAIAWLWYRPLIGAVFLVIAIAGIWYLKKVAKKKKAVSEAVND